MDGIDVSILATGKGPYNSLESGTFDGKYDDGDNEDDYEGNDTNGDAGNGAVGEPPILCPRGGRGRWFVERPRKESDQRRVVVHHVPVTTIESTKRDGRCETRYLASFAYPGDIRRRSSCGGTVI